MGRAEFKFPLMGEQVDRLVEYATTAPFGKGSETVVDLYYRKAMDLPCMPKRSVKQLGIRSLARHVRTRSRFVEQSVCLCGARVL